MSLKKCLGAAFAAFILIGAIGFLMHKGKNSTSSVSSTGSAESITTYSSELKSVSLAADVEFKDDSIQVTNKDSFAWTTVEMCLNGASAASGNCCYTIPLMSPGKTYTVSAMDFTKSDGTHFSPFTKKIQRLFISCKTPEGDGIGSWPAAR